MYFIVIGANQFVHDIWPHNEFSSCTLKGCCIFILISWDIVVLYRSGVPEFAMLSRFASSDIVTILSSGITVYILCLT